MKNFKVFSVVFIFIILSLIFTSTNVYGVTENVVLNTWVKHGHSVSSTYNSYKIESMYPDLYHLEQNYLRIIKNGEEVRFVNYDECYRERYFEYCFLNATIHNDLADWDEYKRFQPALKVKISEFYYPDEVLIRKTLSNREVRVGDEINIKVIFDNIENNNYSNFRVIEEVSPEFEILNISNNWIKLGNELKITTELLKKTKKEYSYTIKALKEGTFTTSSVAIYDIGERYDKTLPKKISTIKVLPALISNEVEDEIINQSNYEQTNINASNDNANYNNSDDNNNVNDNSADENNNNDSQDNSNNEVETNNNNDNNNNNNINEKESIKEKDVNNMNFFEKIIYFFLTLF